MWINLSSFQVFFYNMNNSTFVEFDPVDNESDESAAGQKLNNCDLHCERDQ